jgi:hypothetical protein
MPDAIDSPVPGRATTLIRSAVLAAALAAILFVSYGVLAPLPAGAREWRLPIAVAAAGGLALVTAWPYRRPATRARTADEVAVMLGLASTILGIGAAILVVTGITLGVLENRSTTQSLVHRLTHRSVLISCVAFASPAVITGALGLAIARRRAGSGKRVSAAAMAFRFSAVGLGCAGLIAATAAGAAIYRWLTWG